MRAWSGLDGDHRAFLAQLMRYGVAGVGVTLFQIACFNLLYGAGHQPALLANTLATGVAMLLGYTIHSRFSFKGHGSRDDIARQALRFVAANLIGLSINSLWVWGAEHVLRVSPHLASLPMFFVTPFALFWLNRRWVFE